MKLKRCVLTFAVAGTAASVGMPDLQAGRKGSDADGDCKPALQKHEPGSRSSTAPVCPISLEASLVEKAFATAKEYVTRIEVWKDFGGGLGMSATAYERMMSEVRRRCEVLYLELKCREALRPVFDKVFRDTVKAVVPITKWLDKLSDSDFRKPCIASRMMAWEIFSEFCASYPEHRGDGMSELGFCVSLKQDTARQEKPQVAGIQRKKPKEPPFEYLFERKRSSAMKAAPKAEFVGEGESSKILSTMSDNLKVPESDWRFCVSPDTDTNTREEKIVSHLEPSDVRLPVVPASAFKAPNVSVEQPFASEGSARCEAIREGFVFRIRVLSHHVSRILRSAGVASVKADERYDSREAVIEDLKAEVRKLLDPNAFYAPMTPFSFKGAVYKAVAEQIDACPESDFPGSQGDRERMKDALEQWIRLYPACECGFFGRDDFETLNAKLKTVALLLCKRLRESSFSPSDLSVSEIEDVLAFGRSECFKFIDGLRDTCFRQPVAQSREKVKQYVEAKLRLMEEDVKRIAKLNGERRQASLPLVAEVPGAEPDRSVCTEKPWGLDIP